MTFHKAQRSAVFTRVEEKKMFFGKAPIFGGAAAVMVAGRPAIGRAASSVNLTRPCTPSAFSSDTQRASSSSPPQQLKIKISEDETSIPTCGVEMALHRRHRTRSRWALGARTSFPSLGVAQRWGRGDAAGSGAAARRLHTSGTTMKSEKDDDKKKAPPRKGGWEAATASRITTTRRAAQKAKGSASRTSSKESSDEMVFTAAKEEGGEGGQGPRNPDAAEDDTILQDKGILQVIHNSHLRWGWLNWVCRMFGCVCRCIQAWA